MKILYRRVVFYILILSPLWSFLIWYYSADIKYNILIIDKTVIDKKVNEHSSFNWILDHLSIVKNNGKLYNKQSDYYGFFPIERGSQFVVNDFDTISKSSIKEIADSIDMLYITDTYGVYYNEWYNKGRLTEHSKEIYGGLSSNDYQLIKEVKELNKPIITEFNLFASPTKFNIYKKVSSLLGIKWTGWVGRYFHVLDTIKNPELPLWAVELYEDQYDEEWNFTKSGIVLVHSTEKIIVLENELHLDKSTPFIETKDEYCEEFNVIDKVHYPFWFDITYPDSKMNKVISWYHIYTNSKGDSILKANNLDKKFPAVIKSNDNNKFVYMAGDFCDNPIKPYAAYFSGVEYISFFMYSSSKNNDRRKFFWKYYVPFITNILNTNIKN